MILVIGILVDDGIVIAENIYQHYERGASRMEATINGTLSFCRRCLPRSSPRWWRFLFYYIEGQLGISSATWRP